MKKFLYLLLLILMSVATKAQTFTPLVGQNTQSIGGNVIRYYTPSDYASCPADSLMMIINFAEQDNGTKMDTIAPFKQITAGWDGKVKMNDGSIRRVVYVSIPNIGFFFSTYESMIDVIIRSFNRFDSSKHQQFALSGFGSGAGIAEAWYRQTSVGYIYNKIIIKGLFIQPSTTFGNYSMSVNGRWWFWGSVNDPTTSISGTTAEYNAFLGDKKVTYISTADASHYNDNLDSALTTYGLDSHTGGTALTNRIRFLIDPDDGIIYENKITGIIFKDMFDLCGGSGNPWNFFDEQTANPERGISTPTPVTSSIANAGNRIYFPIKMDSQWRSGVNLRGQYHIKKIWYYISSNAFYEDSITFYKTTNFVGKNSLKRIASVNVPVGGIGWHSIDVDDTTQYVIIGMHRAYNASYNSYSTVELQEVILYGDLIGSREATPVATTNRTDDLKSIDNIIGIDVINGSSSLYMFRPYKHIRYMYGAVDYMDQEWVDLYNISGYSGMRFNYDHYNEYRGGAPWRVTRALIDSQNYYNRSVTWLFSGASQKLINTANVNGPRINSIELDPFHPASYTESGRLLFSFGAAFGNTSWDTSRIPMMGVPRFTAHGMNNGDLNISNGNELNGNWKNPDNGTGLRYMGHYEYVAQSQADYDGFESTLGDTLGVHNADPTNGMSSSSLFECDSLAAQTWVMLSKAMRTDKKQVWNKFQFNWYPHGDTSYVHPVQYDFATKIRKFTNFLKALEPTWKLQLTETSGGDRNINSAQRGPIWSGSGYTRAEQQAITNLYILTEAASANVDACMLYFAVNNGDEANNNGYETASHFTTYPTETKFPAWYMQMNAMNLLKGFRHEEYISRTWGGNYIQKYRSIAHPDSVAYVVGKLSMSNTTASNVTISIPGIIGNAVLYNPSLSAETTSTSTLTPVSDIITIPTVYEKQQIILAREYVDPTPTPRVITIPANRRINKYIIQ